MSMRADTWAIVLAAGDGTRLSAITTDERGDLVPKQFCSLVGNRTLLEDALHRAGRIVPRERVCAIVARRHARHWRQLLRSLPAGNVIVQPRNCGTANGVLLSLLHILERDALANIIFLPADHYVQDEVVLADSLRTAGTLLGHDRDSITLVGIEPDAVDSELGYIVPGERVGDGTRRVTKFVEKPTASVARELIALGAVWNSFIFGARAKALLELMTERLPQIVADMTAAFARHPLEEQRRHALEALYERLPGADFSRVIVQGAEPLLRVRTAPACGWADLGTPQRVAQALRQLRPGPAPGLRVGPLQSPALVNLSVRAAQSLAVS